MASTSQDASSSTTAASSSDPLTAGLQAVDAVDHASNGISKKLRYVDIGINLTDPIFRGIHHGKKAHDDDLEDVIQRALEADVRKMMVTGSDLEESKKAVELAKLYPGLCYATIGVHPCSAHHFVDHPSGPSELLSSLRNLALGASQSGHAVAFGEIGLDYDRLFLTEKEPQLKYFAAQLDLAVEIGLPLFLHSRAASEDFERLLHERLDRLPKRGLVHSFTGSKEEMQRLVNMGFDIGVNGCSLKTEENIAVVKEIPLERIQIETDGPWCEMRPSHASAALTKDATPLPKAVKKEKFAKGLMVKGRNEPCTISHVAWAVAKIKEVRLEVVCEHAWRNSIRMFGLGDSVEGGKGVEEEKAVPEDEEIADEIDEQMQAGRMPPIPTVT